MSNFNRKYLKFRTLATLLIIIISISTVLANFTHTHAGDSTKNQNCPACFLIHSLSESLLTQSATNYNYFEYKQNITYQNEFLVFEQAAKENLSRAPPLF